MDVFFETQSGSSFCIELGYWDTILEIKEKIEKYKCIPVSKQTLCFNGKVLFKDDLDVQQCNILHNSRLQISNIRDSPVRNTDQVLQTELSPPLNSNEKIIRSHQDSILKVQVLQTEKSPPSNSTTKIINSNQDSTFEVQMLQTEQSHPSNSGKYIINIQDSPVKVVRRNNKNDQVLEAEQSPPLKSAKRLINVQDSPVKVVRRKNKNHQVLETKQSKPSNLNKEMIKGHDPWKPAKVRNVNWRMLIFVLPYSGENRPEKKIPVSVNALDNVKELRKQLVKIEHKSGQLKLPQEKYVFLHKQSVMNEDLSFLSNSVFSGNTIEIVGVSLLL